MNTQAEVDAYNAELATMRGQSASDQGLAFARTLDDTGSPRRITEEEAISELERTR